ncbi:hypothetical protein FEM48_Zijuj09G0083100 [Ziziphus jujuba var. spinosa]|uniref:Uncharacterized protein n=1 Tax=Ziziphus jujuba var. spinosa TaxID=714518 RepID=A0A978URW0_ZIZJJ|nr:hypothetical protein FEM48_Zijuj09G0083100 [Ziziphus jujuba var. spinosa]
MIGDDVVTTEGNLEDTATEEPEGTTPEISFHAIAGTNHPQTIWVIGQLQNKDLRVLINGGSTHNFIDQAVITKYGLPIEKSKKFHVMVANKERIECAGLCHALTMKIQGCPVTADYYVLPVAACPVVLGVEWLCAPHYDIQTRWDHSYFSRSPTRTRSPFLEGMPKLPRVSRIGYMILPPAGCHVSHQKNLNPPTRIR